MRMCVHACAFVNLHDSSHLCARDRGERDRQRDKQSFREERRGKVTQTYRQIEPDDKSSQSEADIERDATEAAERKLIDVAV